GEGRVGEAVITSMKKYRDLKGEAVSEVESQLQDQSLRLHSRMATIRHTVAILSGKGGVGKSTLTSNLAAVLAEGGAQVAILDADLNGPAIAKMLGVREASLEFGEQGVEPAKGPLGIKVVSMDHLLPGDATPLRWKAPVPEGNFVWRASADAAALREFLSDTCWGPLDFLLIDLPSGTETLSILAGLLPKVSVAVAVTIPSAVSQRTVKKSITLAVELWGAPTVGVIENMGAYRCAQCGHDEPLFHGLDSAALAREMGVSFLGRVPFDPRLAAASDRGVPFVLQEPRSPCAMALWAVGAAVRSFVQKEGQDSQLAQESVKRGEEGRSK
ncbi:MAG TPA: P-loop NTPase, partial [Candidatus Methylomirabilis sp.]|nr:P-loop NTPase [Candidatus Methylomirabilis sp.]